MTLQVEKREDLRLVRGRETKERVLDASERLFADHGFDGVSIRDIAVEAEVTLGVVGFHAGSKEDLFRTVLARRVEVLSRARLGRLEALNTRRKPPTIREIVEAFVAPYVELASNGGTQWGAYARLIAHLVGDERWFPYVRELFDPVAIEVMDAVRAIRPAVDEHRLAASYMMMVASTSNIVASRARLNALARSRRQAGEASEFLDTIVDFCTAGFEAAIKAERPRRKARVR